MAPASRFDEGIVPTTLVSSTQDADGEGLRRAGRNVTGCILDDSRLADPCELLASPDEGFVGGAGGGAGLGLVNEGLLKMMRLVVLPEILLSQYTERSKCFMGLAEEIGRAWMTIDERLFLWDFRAGRDLSVWASAAGPIIDVRVVRPRRGVFVEAIRWLLVVVTPAEIRLVGVQAEGDLVLHETNLVWGTDQVNMLAVATTPAGRIFCGGQDGHVYELEYEAEEGWFTRRCRKSCRTGTVLSRLAPTFLRGGASSAGGPASVVSLVFDESRQLLWSLTEGSQVEAYSVAQGGWSHAGGLAFHPDDAALLRSHPAMSRSSIGERLVSIHAVGAAESSKAALLAVTCTGLRLYYTLDCRLVAVRVAQPVADPRLGRQLGKPNLNLLVPAIPNVHASFARSGVFMAAGSLDDDLDVLAIRSAHAMLWEWSAEVRLEGRVWDIAEPAGDPPSSSSSSSWWSEIVRGHQALPRQFHVLTNAGIYVFEKERPVDTLVRLLAAAGGNVEAEGVRSFFTAYLPPDQAIAIALLAAIRPSEASFAATNAILKYAGARGTDGSPSALELGLSRFLGRLVAPVWKRSVLGRLDGLDGIIADLRALARFLTLNASFLLLPGEGELVFLDRLVRRTIELLSFLAICQDYQLDMARILEPAVDLELLASSPVRGPQLIKELGGALVRHQMHLQASVDSLCAVLRDRCPTFFSPADVLVFEGMDALDRALRHGALQRPLLEQSLECFLQAGPLDTATGVLVLERYRQARFYRGILLLGERQAALHEPLLGCLADLLKDQPPEAQAVFEAVLATTSGDLLAAFLDWLFLHQVAGTVLLGCSTADARVVRALQEHAFAGEFLASRPHADVLWKVLAKHGRVDEAGEALVRLAQAVTAEPAPLLAIEDRVQYLSLAIATLRAQARPTDGPEDALEVALVQLDLANAMRARGLDTARLSTRLHDLTTLFVDYADPLGLHEISLLIVHTAGLPDAVLVTGLWQRVLPDGDLGQLSRTLAAMAARLYPSEVAFPLGYLVDMLALRAWKAVEASSLAEPQAAAWFKTTWEATNVPAASVAAALRSILAAKDNLFWATPARKRFLASLL